MENQSLTTASGISINVINETDDTSIIEMVAADGTTLARQCSGSCGGKTVGPIDCPDGKV